MKLTLESTPELAEIDGVAVRVWKGRTERGIEVVALIALVGMIMEADASEFDAELIERNVVFDPPGRVNGAGAF